MLIHGLSYITILHYAVSFGYLLVSRSYLIYQERVRNKDKEIKECEAEGGKMPGVNWKGLNNILLGVGFFFIIVWILGIEYADHFTYRLKKRDGTERDAGQKKTNFIASTTSMFAFVFFGTWFFFSMRTACDAAGSKFALYFMIITDIVTEKATLTNFFFTGLLMYSTTDDKFYMASLGLLDILTLSPKLEGVIQAVVVPIGDLIQVFILMLFVSYIFTGFGLYHFGEYYTVYPNDGRMTLTTFVNRTDYEGNSETDAVLLPYDGLNSCPSLIVCFFQTVDVGLRTGDIVGNGMDLITYKEGSTYADRILFGLCFYLILGVILFDIITGVILDQFSILREIGNERQHFLDHTAFISHIPRNEYEEISQSFKFSELTDEHQNMWNYVFFIAYLSQKDAADYSGCESMIMNQKQEGNTQWLPCRNSYHWQEFKKHKHAEAHAGPSLADVENKVAKLEGTIDEIMALIKDKN